MSGSETKQTQSLPTSAYWEKFRPGQVLWGVNWYYCGYFVVYCQVQPH